MTVFIPSAVQYDANVKIIKDKHAAGILGTYAPVH